MIAIALLTTIVAVIMMVIMHRERNPDAVFGWFVAACGYGALFFKHLA